MTEQSIPEYLSYATTNHASDIFIIAGRPLSFKIDGKLSTYGERMMPADTESFLRQIYHMANDRNFDSFLETGDDDFSFSIPGLSRFRVNTYRQRGSLAAVIRVIAFELPDPDVLNIPEDVMSAADFTKGMVLVTGPAGSGNSPPRAVSVPRSNQARQGNKLPVHQPPWPVSLTVSITPVKVISLPLKIRWNTCTGMTNVLSASEKSARIPRAILFPCVPLSARVLTLSFLEKCVIMKLSRLP